MAKKGDKKAANKGDEKTPKKFPQRRLPGLDLDDVRALDRARGRFRDLHQ